MLSGLWIADIRMPATHTPRCTCSSGAAAAVLLEGQSMATLDRTRVVGRSSAHSGGHSYDFCVEEDSHVGRGYQTTQVTGTSTPANRTREQISAGGGQDDAKDERLAEDEEEMDWWVRFPVYQTRDTVSCDARFEESVGGERPVSYVLSGRSGRPDGDPHAIVYKEEAAARVAQQLR